MLLEWDGKGAHNKCHPLYSFSLASVYQKVTLLLGIVRLVVIHDVHILDLYSHADLSGVHLCVDYAVGKEEEHCNEEDAYASCLCRVGQYSIDSCTDAAFLCFLLSLCPKNALFSCNVLCEG